MAGCFAVVQAIQKGEQGKIGEKIGFFGEMIFRENQQTPHTAFLAVYSR